MSLSLSFLFPEKNPVNRESIICFNVAGQATATLSIGRESRITVSRLNS